MKKIILAAFVTMMMLSPVYADEEIQLAAVMVESGDSVADANKQIYAVANTRVGGSSGYAARDPGYEYGILAGIVVAVALASTIDGWDSASNH